MRPAYSTLMRMSSSPTLGIGRSTTLRFSGGPTASRRTARIGLGRLRAGALVPVDDVAAGRDPDRIVLADMRQSAFEITRAIRMADQERVKCYRENAVVLESVLIKRV